MPNAVLQDGKIYVLDHDPSSRRIRDDYIEKLNVPSLTYAVQSSGASLTRDLGITFNNPSTYQHLTNETIARALAKDNPAVPTNWRTNFDKVPLLVVGVPPGLTPEQVLSVLNDIDPVSHRYNTPELAQQAKEKVETVRQSNARMAAQNIEDAGGVSPLAAVTEQMMSNGERLRSDIRVRQEGTTFSIEDRANIEGTGRATISITPHPDYPDRVIVKLDTRFSGLGANTRDAVKGILDGVMDTRSQVFSDFVSNGRPHTISSQEIIRIAEALPAQRQRSIEASFTANAALSQIFQEVGGSQLGNALGLGNKDITDTNKVLPPQSGPAGNEANTFEALLERGPHPEQVAIEQIRRARTVAAVQVLQEQGRIPGESSPHEIVTRAGSGASPAVLTQTANELHEFRQEVAAVRQTMPEAANAEISLNSVIARQEEAERIARENIAKRRENEGFDVLREKHAELKGLSNNELRDLTQQLLDSGKSSSTITIDDLVDAAKNRALFKQVIEATDAREQRVNTTMRALLEADPTLIDRVGNDRLTQLVRDADRDGRAVTDEHIQQAIAQRQAEEASPTFQFEKAKAAELAAEIERVRATMPAEPKPGESLLDHVLRTSAEAESTARANIEAQNAAAFSELLNRSINVTQARIDAESQTVHTEDRIDRGTAANDDLAPKWQRQPVQLAQTQDHGNSPSAVLQRAEMARRGIGGAGKTDQSAVSIESATTRSALGAVTSGDIIIGPNGSVFNGSKPWGMPMSDEVPTMMVSIKREGATVESVRAALSEYPDRVLADMREHRDYADRLLSTSDAVAEYGDRARAWQGSDAGAIIDNRGSIIQDVLDTQGHSRQSTMQLALAYKQAIRDSGITDPQKLRTTRAGEEVLRQYLEAQITPLQNNAEAIQQIIDHKPLHQSNYMLDLNGNVLATETYDQGHSRLSPKADLVNPLPAPDILSSLDDLRYFSQKRAVELAQYSMNSIRNAPTVDAALQAHAAMIESISDSMKLEGETRKRFIDGYKESISDQSLELLHSAQQIQTNIEAQVDGQVRRLEAQPETIVEKARRTSDAHYDRFANLSRDLQPFINQIAADPILGEAARNMRFELAEGQYTFGGGSVGAEANASQHAIRVSHTMLLDMQSGRMTPEILMRNLREEVSHVIDMGNGHSVKPEYASFVDAVYNDPERQKAWGDFASAKHKSRPDYYKQYGNLESEFMVDLLDMQREWTRESGSVETARSRIGSTFGSQALEMIDGFTKVANSHASPYKPVSPSMVQQQSQQQQFQSVPDAQTEAALQAMQKQGTRRGQTIPDTAAMIPNEPPAGTTRQPVLNQDPVQLNAARTQQQRMMEEAQARRNAVKVQQAQSSQPVGGATAPDTATLKNYATAPESSEASVATRNVETPASSVISQSPALASTQSSVTIVAASGAAVEVAAEMQRGTASTVQQLKPTSQIKVEPARSEPVRPIAVNDNEGKTSPVKLAADGGVLTPAGEAVVVQNAAVAKVAAPNPTAAAPTVNGATAQPVIAANPPIPVQQSLSQPSPAQAQPAVQPQSGNATAGQQSQGQPLPAPQTQPQTAGQPQQNIQTEGHAHTVAPVEAVVATAAASKFNGMGGVGLAMSAHQWKAIQERQARGEHVDTAEYVAAIANTGSSALDTVGKSLDGIAASSLGRLAPRLERAGGPIVQAVLAAPMIIAAARTGDTEQIGAATFGAIGGVGAGIAGQALIPVPGVGFVVGVVVGDGAAKVGGLATTAIFNDDPTKREHATAELKQIGVDYFASPGAAANLSGAVVSSVGRAVNTLGEVANWGGDKIDAMAVSAQNGMNQQLRQFIPPVAADAISTVAVLPTRITANTLKAAGTVVSAAGTAVDAVGKASEDVGHHINKGVARFQQTYSQEYQRDRTTHGVVHAAATATVAAAVDVAKKAAGYVEHRAEQAVGAVGYAAGQAQSWYKSHAPSWLGGNSTPAPAAHAPQPSHPTAPAAQNWQQQHYHVNGKDFNSARDAADFLKAHGVTVDTSGGKDGKADGKITVGELNAAIGKYNHDHPAAKASQR